MKDLTWLAPVAGAFLAFQVAAQNLPDLATLQLSGPATAGTSQAIDLTNTVANLGATNSGPWQYQLYMSGDAAITTGDTVLATSVFFPSGLEPGESRTYTNAVTIPPGLAIGAYYFGAIADFSDAIVETNESNNVGVSGPVAVDYGPDLAALDVKGPASAGTSQAIDLTNTIANLGVGDSGSWQYRLYLSPDAALTTGDTVLATSVFFVTGLAPGQTRVYTNSVTMPAGLATGTYYFGAIADFSGSVGESNEANNMGVSGPVVLGLGPDLVVASVSGPALVSPLQAVPVVSAIGNAGVGHSGSWQYRLYLSPDSIITTGDTLLATSIYFSDGIAPGGSSIHTNVVVIPSGLTAGTYYYGAMADPNNDVGESNEGDNTGISSPVLLSTGPRIGAIAVSSNAVALSLTGLVVTFTYTVQRSPELVRPDLWSNAGAFTASSGATSWIDSVSAATVFSYRVLEAAP